MKYIGMTIQLPKKTYLGRARKFQIEETLEKNIEDNLEYRDFCEFTILDCDSSDRVSEWIIDNFSGEKVKWVSTNWSLNKERLRSTDSHGFVSLNQLISSWGVMSLLCMLNSLS